VIREEFDLVYCFEVAEHLIPDMGLDAGAFFSPDSQLPWYSLPLSPARAALAISMNNRPPIGVNVLWAPPGFGISSAAIR